MGKPGNSKNIKNSINNKQIVLSEAISEDSLKYIQNKDTSVIGGWGLRREYEEYMRNNGVSEETIKMVNRLVTGHSNGGPRQQEYDAEIVKHIISNDSIGKAFLMRAGLELETYSEWKNSHPNSKQLTKNELVVYRKGNRKKGVESWTISEDGADFGHGGIGWNHKSSLEALMKEGYFPIAGFGTMGGGPGEGEITFVKVK